MTERSDPVGADVDRPVSVWNVANLLTAVRLALVPVFGWLLLADQARSTAGRLAAAAVFVVAGLTDRLDGEVARRRGLVTDLGKIADPIADKALTGTALVGLSLLGELSWWVTVVVLAREIGITVLRFAMIRRAVIPAGRGGKLKTALQGLAIVGYVLPLSGAWHTLAQLVMAVAVLVTVLSGLHYLYAAYRLTRGTDDAGARDGGASPPTAAE